MFTFQFLTQKVSACERVILLQAKKSRCTQKIINLRHENFSLRSFLAKMSSDIKVISAIYLAEIFSFCTTPSLHYSVLEETLHTLTLLHSDGFCMEHINQQDPRSMLPKPVPEQS